MKLPLRAYKFYAGIDPGFSGAISLINAAGTSVRVWPMPITYRGDGDEDSRREIDLSGLQTIFRFLKRFPDVAVGIEWPNTRPGEGAERSERFGRGKGYLEAFAFLHALEYFKLAPNLWKGRLGLPGKEQDPTSKRAAALWDQMQPARGGMIRGPRGGVLDGPLDALLIASFLRSVGGKTATLVRGSTDAMAHVLGAGPRRQRMRKLPT
jgi:hypothetical protein